MRRVACTLAGAYIFLLAIEVALKLQEIAYIQQRAILRRNDSTAPSRLIEEGTPVIVVAPINELFEKILSNIEEVKARGAQRVIA